MISYLNRLERSKMGKAPHRTLFVIASSFIVFICPGINAQVVSLDPNYPVSLFASGLELPDGGFIYRPTTNDLLVNQENAGAVVRVNASTGAVNVFATLPAGFCPLGNCLQDLNINSSEQVYVPSDTAGTSIPFTVYRFSSAGAFLGSFTALGAGGVAFDSQDNFYISNGTTIFKYPAGTFSSPTVFASGFNQLQVIRFNASGQLIGADRSPGIVYQIVPGGTTNASHIVLASGLKFPDGVAIDPITQNVFVGDEAGNVTRITSPGVFSTFATGVKIAEGLGFDSSGNLYVGDKDVGAIWKFTRIVAGAPPQIQPDHGGNAGVITVHITGGSIESGAQVKLTGIGSDIFGANTKTLNGVLTTTFDLTNVTPGARTVIINNPDGTSVTLPSGFTVEQGGAPQIWVDIIGLDKIRIGSEQTYYIAYGNRGNVDAGLVPVWFAIPRSVAWKVDLPISPLPLLDAGLPALDLTKYPKYLSTDTKTIVPLMVAILPAGQTGFIPIRLQTSDSSSLPIDVWAQPWFFASPLSAPWQSCLNAIANDVIKDLVEKAPLLGCALAIEDVAAAQQKIDDAIRRNNMADIFIYRLDQYFALANESITCASDAALVLGPEGLIIDEAIKLSPLELAVNSYQGLRACQDAYIKADEKKIDVQPVASLDPNDKAGSQGVGVQQYISGATPLRYVIQFGNEPTATAPAQKVVVADQLDLTDDDLTTLSLGPITFGSQLVSPPPFQTSFSTTVDLRPATNLLVAVNSNLNLANRLLTWNFQSLDPATNQPPTDPNVGFLPPGGNGSVFFTVNPKQGLPTNTQIQNQATIVFDVNAPINTPTWLNTLDNTPPTSHVLPLPSTESSASFPVQWTGTDIGAGVQDFTIYVSDNSGPFTVLRQNTPATSATFTGQSGHSYSFYSIARDLTGNMEGAKTTAEATTKLFADTTPPVISGMPAAGCTLWPPNGKLVQVAVVTATDAESGLAPGSFTVTGKSNEPSDPKNPDIVVTSNGSGVFVVKLRADRSGTGTGRIYTLTATVSDLAGNVATSTATCTVPHDQGN